MNSPTPHTTYTSRIRQRLERNASLASSLPSIEMIEAELSVDLHPKEHNDDTHI
jgi:hypothetical protein